MPNLPFEGMDPDEPGSRFTWRVGVMVRSAVDGGRPTSQPDIETGIREALGEAAFEVDEDLGQPSVISGGFGRGAEGFAAIVEWVGTAAGAGVVGGMSWAALSGLVRGVRRLMASIGDKGKERIYVSRGLAVLLAADAILRDDPDATLAVETADEPSALAGYQTPELNYVAIEPWLVTLVDFNGGIRYIVVVRPNGRIAGTLKVPLEEYENIYLPIPRPE